MLVRVELVALHVQDAENTDLHVMYSDHRSLTWWRCGNGDFLLFAVGQNVALLRHRLLQGFEAA